MRIHDSNNRPMCLKCIGISNLFRKIIVLTLVTAVLINNPMTQNVQIAKASIILTPDFTDETVTVQSSSSTKLYVSTDQKTWELIDQGKFDLSTLLTSKGSTIYFKGNADAMVPFAIPAEDTSLKPVYKVVSGTGQIVFTSALPVQYKKGVNGQWISVTGTVLTAMYEVRGATLFFRTAPTAYARAGKPVSVKVPKRPNAPSVRVDGGMFTITGLKEGETQYRLGNSTTWLTFTPLATATDKKSLDITTLLGGNVLNNVSIPAGTIEIRTPGNDKKVSSSVKVIEIPQQPVIATGMASLSSSTLIINDIDKKKQYEYTVVTNTGTLDITKAKWTSVTSSKNVIVPKVNLNDYVLVRAKSYTDSTTKQLVLASTYLRLQVLGITTKL